MDTGLLFGLGLAVAAICGADIMDGGNLLGLINPSALVLILGGTLGATAVSSRLEDLLALPRLLLGALRPPRVDLSEMIERMVALALQSRRNGLLSLEAEIAGIDDPFVRRGLQMIVDGTEAEALRSVLQMDMALHERVTARQINLMDTAGGFAPTMGIIGTVMGLIHVLGNLSDAGALGPSIATAFLATFYGIGTANVFWLPIGNKMKQQAEAAALLHEVALEGILSIQAGDNPSAVRDKLAVFLIAQGQPVGQKAASEPETGAQSPATGPAKGRVA